MDACALNSMEVKAKPARGGKSGRGSGGMAGVLLEKKESEKERRKRMKALCEKLASLIPREHCCCNADTMTQLGSLDAGASYIKKLKERIDELQHRRSSIQALDTIRGDTSIPTPTTITIMSSGAGSPEEGKAWEELAPVLQVRQHNGSTMEVRLICCMERPIKLHEVITIHEEEGATIVNANHSIAGHKMVYTIHSQAFSSRIGIDVSRVSERLGALALPCMHGNLQVLRYTDQSNVSPPKELVSNNDIGGTEKVSHPECETLVGQDQAMWSSMLASISPEIFE